jgi:gamma-glutamyl hercynylcysteine S-oxide synthase
VREDLARGLEHARTRTLALTDLDDTELTAQVSPLMSPLVWDLAHVGQQEDLWLLRGGDGRREGLLPAKVDQLYDAFLHPRAIRPDLGLLSPAQSRRFISDVRGRVLDQLEGADEAFPFAMVEQHEQQHDETMLATHQLRDGPPLLGSGVALPSGRQVSPRSVLVPAGRFVLGVDAADEPYSLDNERPGHVVDLPAFRIGRSPVSNGEWAEFVADGGYAQRRWWSASGWQHRVDAGLERPLFWSADGTRRRFGIEETVPADEPVQHVCYYEAEAYAAWAGGRLPTEVEWEKACVWDPAAGRRRRWPWGDEPPDATRANLGGGALRPAPIGAYPDGASAYGVEQLIGDVWEWTSSSLQPWPGFTPMLYGTYSAPFFGDDYRVLRGGSWGVAPSAVRPSFRNWDLPIRRQIFSGVRLAWDV